jgi:hypothetical protein
MKNGAFAQSLYKQSSVQLEELDTIRYEQDGRVFAYALAGSVALAVGKTNQAPVPDGNANNETLSATQSAAIGATQITVTFGGAVTADYYKDGYIYATDAAGEGTMYRVKGHAAGTADVVVYLKDAVRVAWVASTTIWTAIANRQAYLIIGSAPTITARVAGVAPITVTALYYFWNQVKGPCVCLLSGSVVLGDPVYPLTTAGALGPMANTGIMQPVGNVMSVDATTQYGVVNLCVPGY